MSDLRPTITTELLLAHERFVHAVARDLLRDEHAAQDVVQDTWVQALQRGPQTLVALRSWLGRIATNRARDVQRSAIRRERRERDAMAGAATESVGDTASRLALQRDVVGAVLSLGEPYKSVVLLRYYHGLEPTEIAARLGGKPATVRTQLVRAHELLRERLDRDHGGRAAWAALLLPSPTALPAPAVGSPALKAVAATTVVALAATGFLALRVDDPVPPTVPASAVAAIEPPADATVPDREPAPLVSPRSPVAREQAPPSSTIPEVLGPRAVLREQDPRRGYGSAGFSFLHAYGGVGRTGKDKARGDCDVVFQQGRFRADSVTDDRSLIVVLGAMPVSSLAHGAIDGHLQRVRSAAEQRYARMGDSNARDVMPRAELGHTYFVWTNDTDSDHAAVFQVVEQPTRDTCVLEWYWTEDGTWARCSVRSPAGDRTLAAAVVALRDAVRPVFEAAREREVGPKLMRQPRVVLQARTGAIGGNPCRIDIGRGHSQYFDRVSRDPIALPTPIGIHDDSIAHCGGGLIPDDVMLVIDSVTWSGEAHGDGNGRGCFHVQLGDHELVKVEKSDTPIVGAWTGRVELVRGEEDRAFFEISNSSQGEVVFSGRFEKLPT